MALNQNSVSSGQVTYSEIAQQFELWPDTVCRAATWAQLNAVPQRPLITGAGSSAYAAAAISHAIAGSFWAPTTDLLLDPSSLPPECDALISLGRSGDSPESIGVVRLIQRTYPQLRQISITCNEHGTLANAPRVERLLLCPRTNDRALAMTSSFSNMVLAGMALGHADALIKTVQRLEREADSLLHLASTTAQRAASQPAPRVVVLSSGTMYPLAREAALKITELTAGATVALAETFLGLRHGPMSFLREDTTVLCFFSSDEGTRRYELDLLAELKHKGLGRFLNIAAAGWLPASETFIPALAPELSDSLRTPFEAVFAQLFAFYLSVEQGIDPDEPSPGGVINRIVQGVTIY